MFMNAVHGKILNNQKIILFSTELVEAFLKKIIFKIALK